MNNLLNEYQKELLKALYLSGMNSTELSTIFEMTSNNIRKNLVKLGVKIRNKSECHIKYKIDDTLFEKIDCEWKSYFLGLMYADGNIHGNMIQLSLQKNDREILDKLNLLIYDNKRPLTEKAPYRQFNKSLQTYIHGNGGFLLLISNKKIANDLKNLGCFERKTFTIKFPNSEQVPPELIRHFIRGYFDGDGCITHSGFRSMQFYLCCNQGFGGEIMEYLKSQLPEVNFNMSPDNNIFRIAARGKENIIKIYQWLYQNANIFLERKKNKFEEIISHCDIDKFMNPKYSKSHNLIFDPRKKYSPWGAYVKLEGKKKYIGGFATRDLALQAVTKHLHSDTFENKDDHSTL